MKRACSLQDCAGEYYSRDMCRIHYYRQWRKANAVECGDCGDLIPKGSTLCRPCYDKSRYGRRRVTAEGYVRLSSHQGHPNADASGIILEHVKVMSEMLGRPLVSGENVHHKNGVRDDNRPDNLELWSRSQPSGQRVVDKVQWAKEILALYEPNALADTFARVAS